jgi:hypothetical protein
MYPPSPTGPTRPDPPSLNLLFNQLVKGPLGAVGLAQEARIKRVAEPPLAVRGEVP